MFPLYKTDRQQSHPEFGAWKRIYRKRDGRSLTTQWSCYSVAYNIWDKCTYAQQVGRKELNSRDKIHSAISHIALDGSERNRSNTNQEGGNRASEERQCVRATTGFYLTFYSPIAYCSKGLGEGVK